MIKREDLKKTILVGEDEPEVREYLEMAVKCLGYSVEVAQDGQEVINCITAGTSKISAVLLDIMMPQQDGLQALAEIRRFDPSLPVIVVSGVSSTLNVVNAMRNGATDFLSKPVSRVDLQKALSKALNGYRDIPETALRLPAAAAKSSTFLGASSKMQALQARVKHIGWSEAPVLIRGETGSGKEVLARELHANSPRAGKIFLKLNCAALPSELVESELFGYERGAFTGAFQKRVGMFEMANEGTLLLDEIGDMDVRLQAKLLQVLQDHEFQRIGGKEVIKVDVRFMAATHRDLERAMVEGTFREDLYYRLNVITVQLPPLRERPDDILPLAELLLKKHGGRGTQLPIITPELRQAFLDYHWPGNVRELENTIRKLIALGDPDLLAQDLLAEPPSRCAPAAEPPAPAVHAPKPVARETRAPIWEQVKKAKRKAEADAIIAALDATRWNRKHAAALLQIDYKALLYKMKTLGVEDKERVMPTEELPRCLAAGQAL